MNHGGGWRRLILDRRWCTQGRGIIRRPPHFNRRPRRLTALRLLAIFRHPARLRHLASLRLTRDLGGCSLRASDDRLILTRLVSALRWTLCRTIRLMLKRAIRLALRRTIRLTLLFMRRRALSLHQLMRRLALRLRWLALRLRQLILRLRRPCRLTRPDLSRTLRG